MLVVCMEKNKCSNNILFKRNIINYIYLIIFNGIKNVLTSVLRKIAFKYFYKRFALHDR